jgi:ribosomal protein L34
MLKGSLRSSKRKIKNVSGFIIRNSKKKGKKILKERRTKKRYFLT